MNGPQVGQKEDSFNSYFKVYGTNYTLAKKKGGPHQQEPWQTKGKPQPIRKQDDVY